MKEPSAARIKKVRAQLMADIFWAVKYGPGFDRDHGAAKNGQWHAQTSDGVRCGVCAIGAFCVRNQPRPLKWDGEIHEAMSAARALRVPRQWCQSLYWEVAHNNYGEIVDNTRVPEPIHLRIKQLARELRAYGESLDRVALRDEAAQEEQEFAESLGLA